MFGSYLNINKVASPKKVDIEIFKSFEDIDSEIKKLALRKSIMLDEHITSKDVDKIIKASSYLAKIERNDNKTGNLKAYFFSPDNEFNNGLGYKSTTKSLTFDMLKKMSKTPVINSVITTRIEQIKRFLQFTTDSQKEGWTIKKKVSPFDEKEYKITDKDKQVIEKISKFLQDGGENNKWDLNDDFEEFVSKFMYDSLSLDHAAYEVERNRGYKVVSYMAVDSGLIRFLETIDPVRREEEKQKYDEVFGYLPIYCQTYNNQILRNPVTQEEIIYYPWELCLGIRNKQTNIRHNGYGVSELEILCEIVTWLLWGMQYNGNFFKNGSNPKGFFSLPTGGEVDQTMLNEFRSAWRQTMVGVTNSHKTPIFNNDVKWNDMQSCLCGDTEIIIKDKGKSTLEQVLGNNKEVDSEIWDGLTFNKAKIYRTEEKDVCKLVLHNRLEIESSPDHKFLVLRDNIPTWVERKNIQIGDYVFVNKNKIEDNKEKLKYKGRIIEDDLFELLGWITGDGHIDKNKCNRRRVKLFYHPLKEMDILDYHLNILAKYGINSHKYIKVTSEEKANIFMKKWGIKSLIKENPYIHIVDSDFHKWIIGLGFNPSSEGKVIPDFLYSFDSKCKCAFLRGFFSADGHISTNGSRVDITITNSLLKWQTRLLLMTEGIRCSSFKHKKIRGQFNSLQEDMVLLIKDRDIFFEKIGFIQKYKNKREKIRIKSLYKEFEAPIEFVKYLALQVKEFNKTLPIEQRLSRKHLHDLLNISRGYQRGSLYKILFYAEEIGYKTPSFLNDFSLERVIELTDLGYKESMCDVEMYNENHQFFANGIIVHNSNKDMEHARWIELLTVVACSVYHIDPSELGYRLEFQKQSFSQDGQKERIEHSKEKGLIPLLIFLSKQINKYIVSELDPNYQFTFTGVNIENEQVALDNDIKKVANGFISMEDGFKKYSDREFNEDKDTILNSVYQQAKAAKNFGGQQTNDAVDQMQGEENPFKQDENNSIAKSVQDYINKAFSK